MLPTATGGVQLHRGGNHAVPKVIMMLHPLHPIKEEGEYVYVMVESDYRGAANWKRPMKTEGREISSEKTHQNRFSDARKVDAD